MEVVSLVEGEWLSYRGDHFNGEKMVITWRWSVQWRENGYLKEVITLMERKCHRGGH